MSPQEDNSLWLVRDAEGWPIAELRVVLKSEGGHERARAEGVVREMLAGPDVLVALNALADASENAVDSFGGHSLECDCEQCVALSKLAPVAELAREAIARAEGK